MIVMLTLVVMVVLITRIETENPEMQMVQSQKQMVKYSSRITGGGGFNNLSGGGEEETEPPSSHIHACYYTASL